MNKQTNSMLRRLLMVALMATPALRGYASDGESLTLNVNGSPVVIVLAEHPVITYTGNTLHIKTDATTIDIPVNEITGGSFGNETAVHSVELPDLQTYNGEICFCQLPSGSRVEVFSTGGAKLMDTTADNAGQATISMSRLPKGAYIVKSAFQTFKIMNN